MAHLHHQRRLNHRLVFRWVGADAQESILALQLDSDLSWQWCECDPGLEITAPFIAYDWA